MPRRAPRRAITFATAPQGATTRQIPRSPSLPKRSASIRDEQRDAYFYARKVGEARYVTHLRANTVAACTLKVQKLSEDGLSWEDSEDPRAAGVMAAWVAKGSGGSARGLAKQFVLNRSIGGEVWLLVAPNPAGDGFTVEFLSARELEFDGQGRPVRRTDLTTGATVPVPAGSYWRRSITPNPEFTEMPDSPIMGVLNELRQLFKLRQYIDGVIDTRLHAGIAFFPNSMSFGAEAPEDVGDPQPDDAEEQVDPFTAQLIEHVSAPIENPTSASAVVPLVMRGDTDEKKGGSGVEFIEIGRNIGEWAITLREELISTIARGLDVDPSQLEGMSNVNHWCMSSDMEVLSEHGWVGMNELAVGDLMLTLNHETGTSEWQPCEMVNIFNVEDETMLSVEGARHSSLTTLNHRWPIMHRRQKAVKTKDGRITTEELPTERRWAKSIELNTQDSLIVGAPSADRPVEQKWSDALVEVLAWFWTEGSFPKRSTAQATISQSFAVNPENCDRIRSALTGVFGPEVKSFGSGKKGGRPPGGRRQAAWREHTRASRLGMSEFLLNASAADALRPFFSDVNRKVLRLDFIRELTLAQLELFIHVSMLGDRNRDHPNGSQTLSQSDASRLVPLELAAVLAGRSVNTYPVQGRPLVTLSMSLRTKFGLGGKRLEPVKYTGEVWCPTTANGSIFAKRNGKAFFTGNSAGSVDADFTSKHVLPEGNDHAEFCTDAYLRPFLRTWYGLSKSEANQFRVIFDASNITAKADRGITALTMWRDGLIDDEAAVRANGFLEADMPNETEKLERFLALLLMSNPDYVTQLAEHVPWMRPIADAAAKQTVAEPVAKLPSTKRATLPPLPRDPQSGGGEPPSPAIEGIAAATLHERVTTASHSAVLRACEIAGSRAVTKASKVPGVKAKIRNTEKVMVLSTLTKDDFTAMGVTPADLLVGSWDALAHEVESWLILAGRNRPDARQIVLELTGHLQEMSESGVIIRHPNGLVVPDELIASVLR